MSQTFDYLVTSGRVDVPDRVGELGVSASAVWAYLDTNGESVAIDMTAAMGLSPGSVYPALEQLESAGLVESRPHIHRGKATLYAVRGELSTPTIEADA